MKHNTQSMKHNTLRNRLTVLLMITTACISLTACGQPKKVIEADYTEASRTVSIQNKDEVVNTLLSIIQGNEIDVTSVSFIDDNFYFNTNDISSDTSEYRYYFFNGSCYIQLGEYMYRFQFVNDVIDSYIKYNLEA